MLLPPVDMALKGPTLPVKAGLALRSTESTQGALREAVTIPILPTEENFTVNDVHKQELLITF
jgi:hypothetical protein